MLPTCTCKITKGEAQGDYRCIPKVSKQLRYLPEGDNRLRLWLIPFSLSMKYEFLMRCLSDFKTSLDQSILCIPYSKKRHTVC